MSPYIFLIHIDRIWPKRLGKVRLCEYMDGVIEDDIEGTVQSQS